MGPTMAETTGIAWTRSTFNPWLGCTEVSPGCDGCYARELDKRHRYGGATHWGASVPRFHTSDAYWKQPERWNRVALRERASSQIEDKSGWHTPGFWPVFPSMCDPFDNEVPDAWRTDLFGIIHATPALTWLLLTKRIGNAAKMMLPSMLDHPLPNLRLGASIVNQEEADRDLPKLKATPAAKRFVSYEPALGPVDWSESLAGIDQVIFGGESNQGKHMARPCSLDWARSARDHCRTFGVAFFMKQAGADPRVRIGDTNTLLPYAPRMKDRAGADPAEWPEDLRVQEFPR